MCGGNYILLSFLFHKVACFTNSILSNDKVQFSRVIHFSKKSVPVLRPSQLRKLSSHYIKATKIQSLPLG